MQSSLISSPDVSIVVPARNEERFVAATLDSIVAQSWPLDRLEVVVVDNGSTDATGRVVQEFIAATPQLAVQLVDEPVAGVSRAKNRGAWAARGRLLLFLDADSQMTPNLIEEVMRCASNGYQAASIKIVADTDDPLDRAFFGLLEFGKELFRLPAQMFYCERLPFIRLGGFDESLYLAEDRELLLRLRRNGLRLGRVTKAWIATSPRRLHRLPGRLGMVAMFGRWALANWGIGRRWRY